MPWSGITADDQNYWGLHLVVSPKTQGRRHTAELQEAVDGHWLATSEPALGISSTFPEDSNYGLVNDKDEAYEVLVKAATEVNLQVESRHARSAFSGSLELRAAKNGFEAVNTNQLASRGLVRITSGGRSRIQEISLSPAQARGFALPAREPACVELQNWDGSKQRLICGLTLGPLEVVNVSAVTVSGVPVLIEGAKPAAGWLRELAPGRTAKLPPPTADWAKPNALELAANGVIWSCSRKGGSLFDRIQAGDLVLGRLVFAAHQRIDNQDQWAECDRIVSLRMQEQPDAWLLEAVFGGGETSSGDSFRAGVRVAVFKQAGLVLARPLWVENTGTRGWRLVEVYWFCRPSIGGSPEDDVVGGADVPNYYRAAQFWTDSRLGGCLGADRGVVQVGDSAALERRERQFCRGGPGAVEGGCRGKAGRREWASR